MIHVLGIPFDANSSYLRGAALAPARIRLMESEGSANRFAENGTEIVSGVNYHDEGDIHFEDINPSRAFHKIQEKAGAIISKRKKLLSLGGDHSVSWPLISAYTEHWPDLHILQLDAHADLYEDFDGNPYSHASPFARIMESGKVASLTQVGIRTLTRHQREQAARYGVRLVEMRHFETSFLSHLKSPLYISLDMDVLDPSCAPGVSHHEPGGMQTRQLLHIIQNIQVPVVGADIVEYNPVRDTHYATAMVAYRLFRELTALMLSSSNP